MKKVILTQEQIMEAIRDTDKTVVSFKGNNSTEMAQNAQAEFNNAIKAGINPNSITINGATANNNLTDNDSTTINIDSTQSNIKDAVKNAVDGAVRNGADINKIEVKGNAEDIGENRVYTKKQVIESRLYNMRKNANIFTKEEFCNG